MLQQQLQAKPRRLLNLLAEPNVKVGDGATTRRIGSTSASTQLVFSAPCEGESNEVISIVDVRSRAFGLMNDFQLCGGADQDSLCESGAR